MKHLFTLRVWHATLSKLELLKLTTLLGLFLLFSLQASAASFTATLSGNTTWASIAFTPAGPPAASDDITFTITAASVVTAIPAIAYGSVTINNTSGGSRALTFTVVAGTSFTSTTLAGTAATPFTVAGTPYVCPIFSITNSIPTTVNYSTFGWGAGNNLTVNVDVAASHTLTVTSGANHGTLTLNNNGAAARTLNLTNSSPLTRFNNVVLGSSGGGVLTVTVGTNRIQTTALTNTFSLSGTGTLNMNGLAGYATGHNIAIQAVGGNFTINGFSSSQTGVDLTLASDGTPRTITAGAPSAGSHRNISVATNTTYVTGGITTATGNITGAGNVSHTNALTLTAGNINISGNFTGATNALSVTGNVTVSGTYTTTSSPITVTGTMSVTGATSMTSAGLLTVGGDATFGNNLARSIAGGAMTFGGNLSVTGAFTNTVSANLTLNGTAGQTVSYGSGTPVITSLLISNTTGPIAWSGNADITTNLTNNASAGLTFSAGTITFASSGGTISSPNLINFNNLAGLRIGGAPVYSIDCDLTVNGTFTGNSASSHTFQLVKNATNTPRTITFKGAFDANLSQSFTSGNFTTTGNLFHNIIFESSTVNFRTLPFFNAVAGTVATAGAGFTHGIDIYFRAPIGGQSVSGGSPANVWRNFNVDGSTTDDVIWSFTGQNTLTGNFNNNANSDFTTIAGNGVGGNLFDRFMFTGAGIHTIGSASGGIIELNQLSSINGANVQLLQDVTLNKLLLVEVICLIHELLVWTLQVSLISMVRY